jgi:alkanesulfonate monooxygenase SsuD/methylene tetrahydromethanopterin reductase-like flavin-dependent oxidoreductase (luciferase family)
VYGVVGQERVGYSICAWVSKDMMRFDGMSTVEMNRRSTRVVRGQWSMKALTLLRHKPAKLAPSPPQPPAPPRGQGRVV